MNERIAAFLRDSTAVVLCGGRSARMGAPKPQLFLDRILSQLSCFDRIALSVRDLDQMPEARLPRFPLWEDCVKDCGPLGGILTALKRAETPWAFVVPCDVPGITRAFIEELYGRLKEDDPCLVPVVCGTLQPLIGVYNVSCAPVLERVLEEKLFRVRALLDRLPTHYARFDETWADVFFNVNTPEDYERWLSEREGPKVKDKQRIKDGTPEIPVYSIVAWSGAGKTTLLEGLIPELKRRGLRMAVIKHDAHDFEIDREGKDTWRLTRAGADVTAIASASRAAIMENRPVSEDALLGHIHDVDVILTEGFKHGPWRKIGLRRGSFELPPGEYAAVVSDAPLELGIEVPVFALDDLAGLADWIVSDSQRSCYRV